jgi:hypothetical protein
MSLVAAAFAANQAAATNFPFTDPRGLARVQQAEFDAQLDPTATCRVVTSYAVRCSLHFHGSYLANEMLTKVGPHKVRMSGGGASRVGPVPPTSPLYAYV